MTDDTWAKERAERLADLGERERHNLGFRARTVAANVAALVEAEKRGEARTQAQHLPVQQMCLQVGRDEILARLANPDKAMIEAVKMYAGDEEGACHALAAVLSASPEEG